MRDRSRLLAGALLLLLHLTPLPLAGQSVIGRVLDRDTDRPIEGATITLGEGRAAAVTDTLGRFVVRDVAPGAYRIQIEHVAYGTHADSVTVPAGDVVELTIRVAAEPIALDPIDVEVLSDVERRRRAQGHSHHLFVTREDLDRYVERGARGVGEALRMHNPLAVRTRPAGSADKPLGVCIESGRFARDRTARAMPRRTIVPRPAPGKAAAMLLDPNCDMVLVLLDGMRVPEYLVASMLDDLHLDEVENMEFLPPTEALVRYGGLGERGVLVIETRGGMTLEGLPAGAAEAVTDEQLLERIAEPQPPSRWPYLGAGVAVGLLAGGVYLVHEGIGFVDPCNQGGVRCVRREFLQILLPFAAGAAVGAVGGELYFRFAVDVPTPR